LDQRCVICGKEHLEGELLDIVHRHLVKGMEYAGAEKWLEAYKEMLKAISVLTDYIDTMEKDCGSPEIVFSVN